MRPKFVTEEEDLDGDTPAESIFQTRKKKKGCTDDLVNVLQKEGDKGMLGEVRKRARKGKLTPSAGEKGQP